jgi:hypothetical protein
VSDSTDIKFPDIEVQLSNSDGNVFSIIGTVSMALKRAGHKEAAKEFSAAALKCRSYDEVLALCMRTVEIT